MKTHTLKFLIEDRDKFQAIIDETQTIETRAGTSLYAKIKVGDVLRFSCNGVFVEKRVARIKHFASVAAVYASRDFDKILPGVKTLEEAERTYYGFIGYRERIARYGLIAFYLTDYVSIRPMKTSDAPHIQELSQQYLGSWFGDQLNPVKEWLLGSNYKTAWVAEVDGSVVGFAIVSDKPDRDYLKLSSMVVDTELRRRGVGTHLLARCLAYMDESRKDRILLTVSEDNRLSRGFFEHQGFRHVGTVANKFRPGKAELIYTRFLH